MLPLPPPPPPPPEAGGRLRKPRRPDIFCCSFLRISSRSGGPSLFFFPHWGSFGGIGEWIRKGGTTSQVGSNGPLSSSGGDGVSVVVARDLRQRIAKAVDSGAGERTHLDIQHLTIRVAHDFGL